MAPKKKTARPSVVEAPAELSLAARGEAQIQLLRDLNTRLMKEIKQLRSDLASSAARSDAELRRANEQLEAERVVASDAMEKLIKKAEEKNLKTAEAAGLKLQPYNPSCNDWRLEPESGAHSISGEQKKGMELGVSPCYRGHCCGCPNVCCKSTLSSRFF